MHFTGTIWRPPYEAGSTLVQVTAGCTHHRCKFCTLYEDVPFPFRLSPLAEVEADLQEMSENLPSTRRLFFTGANPFALHFDKLQTLALMAKSYFPQLTSIGCFARITDITPKTTKQLLALRHLGYDGLTIGVETGDEEALAFMHKGYGAHDILTQCARLDEVGMRYNFFYLTGISGAGRGEIGAKRTAAIFNQLHPQIIVPSMLTVYPTSRLYQDIQAGTWQEASELEKLHELKTLIAHLTIPTYLATMGASNYIFIDGYLPQDQAPMLKLLEKAIASTDEQALRQYRTNLRHL